MIKNKEDAGKFVEKIKKCSAFVFYNEGISMQHHGTTEYRVEEDGRFSGYNFGQGWEDQGKTYYDKEDFIKMIYIERKYINRALKSEFYEFIKEA